MGKRFETVVDRFDGGMVSDPRDRREGTCRFTSNFNISENPQRLIPYPDTEDGGGGTSKKQNFALARRTGTTHSIYSLGVQSGASDAQVLYKNLTTGLSNDLDDTGWATPSNNEQGTGSSVSFDCFVAYRNQDEIYSIRDSQFIQAFSPTGSAWIDTEIDLGSGINNVAQGLVHSKDDICYIPYDNKIASKNGSSGFSVTALTLPAHLFITSIAEFGNLLAIACSPLSKLGNSVVYLWDRNSSLATLTENIDWGQGQLLVLDTVQGELIGISLLGNLTPYVERYSIVFKRFVRGVGAVPFERLYTETSVRSSHVAKAKQIYDNRLYFMMELTVAGSDRIGVWSVGRSPLTGEFTVVLERPLDNDTSRITANLHNFIIVGDVIIMAFDDSGFLVRKTNATVAYSATKSIYETSIFRLEGASFKKDLVGVTLECEPLGSNGNLDLFFQTDADIGSGTWGSTILTVATENDISGSAVDGLPKDYKEIQFRIESTFQAVVTALSFKEEFVGKRDYD